MSSSTPAPDAASSAAEQVRRLTYLHDAVDLYSRSSPALAALYGFQFAQRAHNDGIALNDAVTKTICAKCGALLVPAVTRKVTIQGRGKGLVVQQQCCRCRHRVMVQGKVVKSDRKRVPVVGKVNGSGATKEENVGRATHASVASTPLNAPKLNKSVGDSASKLCPVAAKALLGGSKQDRAQVQKGFKGKGKMVEQKALQDDDSPSRRRLCKKKSTLRGLLSLQKKNEADSKSLSLNDFLSNL